MEKGQVERAIQLHHLVMSGEQAPLHEVFSHDRVLWLGQGCSPVVLGMADETYRRLKMELSAWRAQYPQREVSRRFLARAREEGLVANKRAAGVLMQNLLAGPDRTRFIQPWRVT